MSPVGGVEHNSAFGPDLVGGAVVDGGYWQEPDPGVAMLEVGPGEEADAAVSGVVDAGEPGWDQGPGFRGPVRSLGERVVVRCRFILLLWAGTTGMTHGVELYDGWGGVPRPVSRGERWVSSDSRGLSEESAGEVEVDSTTEILFVGPRLVECEGVGPQLCLLVRRGPDADWELFYDTIDGFEHVPGTSYQLEVRVSVAENPPMDGSSLRYELIRVVAQQP